MKVSVKTITYNHEKYIAQAIESVMMQHVTFDYELVIGEDCSTDNTRNIVLAYRDRYPDKIRVLLADTNLGALNNSERTEAACRGEYVAYLEGDDFWTSSDKLQKQVDFLDNHPECSICFHNVNVLSDSQGQIIRQYCGTDQKEFTALEDILVANYIPTCSVMFRNRFIQKLPDWFAKLPMTDWPTHVMNAQHGNIGYINEVMATYRVHDGGVWSRMGYAERITANLRFYKEINRYLSYRYDALISAQASAWWKRLSVELIEQGYQLGLQNPDINHVMTIFESWPDAIPYTREWRTDVLGHIYERLLFAFHAARRNAECRYALARLIQYNPAGLKNRGVWSIGSSILLGDRITRNARRAVRNIIP